MYVNLYKYPQKKSYIFLSLTVWLIFTWVVHLQFFSLLMGWIKLLHSYEVDRYERTGIITLFCLHGK